MSGEEKIKKVSIIFSKGSLEAIYPGLIMANGARMQGIEVNLFFTFFGMEAITKKKMDKVKVATVGNPAMGIPTLIGGLPGMSAFATNKMKKQMDELDIPPIPEFIEMINDAGGTIYACLATVEMFKLSREDFCDELEDIITVGDFYDLSAGGQIIFT
ncbi:DsrE/DsrF/DrsH-like family protein [Bacillaceae bacterium S4-13-58]